MIQEHGEILWRSKSLKFIFYLVFSWFRQKPEVLVRIWLVQIVLLSLIRVGIHHMMFNHCFEFIVLVKRKMFLFIDLLVLEQWRRKSTKDKSTKVHLGFELLMNSKLIGMYPSRDENFP